jgi:ABC-type sugar transport system ATPase subunit
VASARFEAATKRFGDVAAVSELTLEVADGEFLVLLGPSGSGKSTALRLLAGLEPLTAGHIWIGDRLADHLAPKDRDIAMVFQDYALYPQMRVEANMAFGLKMRRIPKPEILRRVHAAADALELGPLLRRYPRELSGGQRQRVALGRALVRDPQVFLMDEPLSNLDAALRVQTRGQVKRLQQELRTTTVYVTHDQVEAMTLGDRVAVLKDGLLQQVGVPTDIYDAPANVFVASFIGTPAMAINRFSIDRLASPTPLLRREGIEISMSGHSLLHDLTEVFVGARPEHVKLWEVGSDLIGPFVGVVEFIESLGRETFIGLSMPGDAGFVAHADGRCHLPIASRVEFGILPDTLYMFHPEDGSLLTRPESPRTRELGGARVLR